jgi:hypothetical protein
MKAEMVEAPPQALLVQMVCGSILSQAVYAAASLGVADQLTNGPKTAAELAHATGAHPGAMHRLMRALVSVDVFSQSGEARFGLAPMGECLRSDVPQSLRNMVLMMGAKWRLRTWEEIVHSIKTGKSSFNAVFGMGPFDYFRQNPEAAEVFNRAMVSYTSSIAPAIAAAYDFSACGKLVDVAGGHGHLIATIVKANPGLEGILFDLPDVVKGAASLLRQEGVTDRCVAVGGNFFEWVPPGGDVYLMKQVIHDWDDEEALTILRNCHKVIPAKGKILLIETVIPKGNEPSHAKLLDLEVLLALGGKERTEKEYADLYAAAGFTLTRVIPTQAGIHIVEGTAV